MWVFAFAIGIPIESKVDGSVIPDPVYAGKLDASTGPPPLRNAVMTRIVRAGPTTLLPSFRVQILHHGILYQGICAGLIAPALPPQPGDHIRVKAKSREEHEECEREK